MYKCTIIGISDSRKQWFPPHVMEVIRTGHVFSGGKRHAEIMGALLPEGALWIDITVPLDAVFRQYAQHDEVVIFASGDPLFYGFANTVQRECPEVRMTVYPSFHSLQMLAHRMCLPYHDMHVVSLTGRPWDCFDEALINGEPLIGCLTDRHNTPHAIMQRMLDYGYDNYRMTVGENLGNEHAERISTYSSAASYAHPNCIILQRTYQRPRPFGIPEQAFHLLNGRAKMITKMPIRLLSLSMLDLRNRLSFWDVGFCTGSVSIEARLQFPHLHITAFEVREEGRELMAANSRRFGAPGIESVIGDFLDADLTAYPAPDAVFIGGHGGRLKEMIARLRTVLTPDGVIVFNSVTDDSRRLFEAGVEAAGMTIVQSTRIAIDEHNPIQVLLARQVSET